MSLSEFTLAYESGAPGALQAGERVLWEWHPQPSPPPRLLKYRRPNAVLAVTLIAGSTAAMAGIGTHGDPLIVTLVALVMATLTVIAVLATKQREQRESNDHQRILYRITD